MEVKAKEFDFDQFLIDTQEKVGIMPPCKHHMHAVASNSAYSARHSMNRLDSVAV